MQAPLVPITLAFLMGILVGTGVRFPLWSVGVVGIMSAGVALRRWRRARVGCIALLLLWVCLGALRMGAWLLHPDAYLTQWLPEEPQRVQLHGMVLSDPTALLTPRDSAGQSCVIDVRHVRGSRGWSPMAGQLRATLPDLRQPLAYGDDVLLEGEWSRVPGPSNPGQYDWAAALARQRIHGLLRIAPRDGVVVLKRGQGNPHSAAVARLRRRWEQLITEAFAPQNAGLLRSLLLGQRTALDDRLREAFVATGTMHLLVISGFNVGLIAGMLELALRWLGVPWRARLLLCAIGLGGYCELTGLQPPVVRATVMAWTVLGALALDRLLSWWNALAAAALAILWVNPSQLFDPGFQLSFGAVASLLVFIPRWLGRCESMLRWLRPAWVRRYVALSLTATTAVWAGLSPLLAWYFHLVSPVSVVANLLIVPLMSGLVALGTGLLTLGTVYAPVVRWGSGAVECLLRVTLHGVAWCHAIPGGSWQVGRPSWTWLAGYVGLVAVSLLKRRLGWTAGRLLICWLAGVALWVWGGVITAARESRWLRVDLLDVGHGDSVLVRLPAGRTLLVDAGSVEAGTFRLLPYLQAQGVTTLDALLLTHPDADHIGGAVPLLRAIRVRQLLTNGAQDDTMSARQIRRLVRERRIGHSTLASGTVVVGDSRVRLEVLHPPNGLVPGEVPASNDNSVVLKLTYGAVSFLLCGDIEEEGLPWLLRSGHALRATVLKVPHHGSRLGEVGRRFFEAVRPQAAILSVGRVHHLPAAETLEALRATGAAIYSTRDDGAITVRTDGRRFEVTTFNSKQRRIFDFGF